MKCGGSRGGEITFEPHAEPAKTELIERKWCEGYGCGGYFWRPVPRTARDGQKVCAACQAREAMQVAKENEKNRRAQNKTRNRGVDLEKLQSRIERELRGEIRSRYVA